MPVKYSRSIQGLILLVLFTFLTFSLHTLNHAGKAGDSVVDHYKDVLTKLPKAMSKRPREAVQLYPEELMHRPLATNFTQIPKLFHQSWANGTLPDKFDEWSHSCRRAHPDWEWVLWTDEDNLKLVEKHAPWFMDAYEELQTEIFRADAARHIYMHVFGGVYADLDTECLRPYDSMFKRYNTSTTPHSAITLSSGASSSLKDEAERPSKIKDKTSLKLRKKSQYIPQERKAFLGRMGTDEEFPHSIPNAWMASTPSHPFWLLPLESIKDNVHSGTQPEFLTGPTALYARVKQYKEEYAGGDKGKMDEHYAKGPWRHLFKPSAREQLTASPQSMVILPFWEVYPYSWDRDGSMYRHVCWVLDDEFDAKRCKSFLGLDARKSHSITYWSHSWSESSGGNGHRHESMKHISASDDNTTEPKDEEAEHKEDNKGDANEWKEQAEEWKKSQEGRKKKQEARREKHKKKVREMGMKTE